jgi:hypothetical protein
MKPLFKLETEIKKLPNCPPNDCGNRCVTATRFVHNPLTTKSFETYFEMENDTSRNPCIGRALSLFDSETNARKHFYKLQKNTPLIAKKIGNYIAKGEIDQHDGEVTQADHKGHFSLFEYKDRDLLSKFEIVERL